MDAPNQTYWRIQLADAVTGQAIIASGGVCYVASAGDPAKVALKTSAGAAASNPLTLSRGLIEFYTAVTVLSVDLFIQCPGGQFLVAESITPSGPNELRVDTGRYNQVMVIPFAQADFAAATEITSGFTVPVGGMILPTPAVRVTAIDATEDIDVGTLSTDSGDADGYIDSVSLGALGTIKATLLASADTMGALLSVLDSANAGDDAPEADNTMSGKAITYTTSAGSDTGKGYIYLPCLLTGLPA